MNHETAFMVDPPSSAMQGAPEELWAAQSVRVAEAPIPASVLIIPWGEVATAHGAFVLDDEAGQAILASFRQQGTDVPVDYEHQSLGGAFAAPSGLAPAAGWIRRLRLVRPGESDGASAGLYADVEWTAGARAHLAGRQYRYLSPVLMVRRDDRRVVALHSVALTNKPAIVGMKPIINRQPFPADELSPEGGPPEGGGPTPSPEPGRSSPAVAGALERLCLRRELDPASPSEAVLRAADARLAALMEEQADRRARGEVAAAERAGKLVPAQRDWALALARRDPEAFAAWSASAPVVVRIGRLLEEPFTSSERDREALAEAARRAYRAEPALARLTDEAAWVRQALRDAGLAEMDS